MISRNEVVAGEFARVAFEATLSTSRADQSKRSGSAGRAERGLLILSAALWIDVLTRRFEFDMTAQ